MKLIFVAVLVVLGALQVATAQKCQCPKSKTFVCGDDDQMFDRKCLMSNCGQIAKCKVPAKTMLMLKRPLDSSFIIIRSLRGKDSCIFWGNCGENGLN